jgi:hypothetical protein
LRQGGLLVDSHKLTDGDGRVVRRDGGRVRVAEGPYAVGEVLGGYFTITAPTYDDAIRRLEDCPHLEFGTIEVREIDRG